MADTMLENGTLSALVQDGGLRAVTFAGVELLRGLTYPVRNPDWGTHLIRTTAETTTAQGYRHDFTETDGLFTGTFTATLDTPNRLTATVTLTFTRAARVNRAGFTLLHPILGTAGEPLRLHHPDGGETLTTFPALISPAQPARNIAGLSHSVAGIGVTLTLTGDTFEMEDQRNWSDASFKTYCRPLALPFPYPVAAGETLTQTVILDITPAPATGTAPARPAETTVPLPQVLLAHEHALSPSAGIGTLPLPLQYRLTPETPDEDLQAAARHGVTALEIIFDSLPDLHALIARARMAGLTPARVSALPSPFLKSHQPDGQWPTGAQPADAPPVLRTAFPQALIGGGSLTNFTELNRHRPDPATVDFVTFGNTAIVHAADDTSVWQTLQALPDIFATAHAIAAGRPLHLGLLSIGMRCNPYGDKTAPNPHRLRLPMAMEDPRQSTGFAAAYAVAALARAARARVASLALAMTAGPLGPHGPLADILRTAHAMAGQPARITDAAGLIRIETPTAALYANCTPHTAPPPRAGLPPLPGESAQVWQG
ncbi:hypothetical protein [Tabrizicola sp. M-4]|uniref:hypothetical protein n=1 Tax=Tabrizicola sp. M-4 TaxID=3055847 RepID=UPI003DA857AC